MDGVVDFLKRHSDLLWKIAIVVALLSIFYPLAAGFYTWLGGEKVLINHPKLSFWVLGNYFFDPLIAAIVLGALVREWRVAFLALVGLGLQLVLTTGALITDNENITRISGFTEDISSFQIDLQLYLTSSLRWIWIFGLIAFGVALGRKVGDLFSELDDEPDSSPAA